MRAGRDDSASLADPDYGDGDARDAKDASMRRWSMADTGTARRRRDHRRRPATTAVFAAIGIRARKTPKAGRRLRRIDRRCAAPARQGCGVRIVQRDDAFGVFARAG